MESRDWWVDAGDDGESKQEKCQCAKQTNGWRLAGRKLPPSLHPEMCCPINVARGLFSCCNRSCAADTIAEGEAAWIPGVTDQSRSTCLRWERREQNASELPQHEAVISPLTGLLRGPLFFFFFIRMLFTTLPALLLIVNLITLTICKVAVWSVRCDTSGEWMRWMGATEIRFDRIMYLIKLTTQRRLLSTGRRGFLLSVKSSDTDNSLSSVSPVNCIKSVLWWAVCVWRGLSACMQACVIVYVCPSGVE